MLRQVLPCSPYLLATRRLSNTQPSQSRSSGAVFACLISRQGLSAWARGCAESFELFIVLSRLLGTQLRINHSFVAADMIPVPTWWNQDPLVWLLNVWSSPPAATPPFKEFCGNTDFAGRALGPLNQSALPHFCILMHDSWCWSWESAVVSDISGPVFILLPLSTHHSCFPYACLFLHPPAFLVHCFNCFLSCVLNPVAPVRPIPAYKVPMVHLLYPFLAVLWVAGTVGVADIQWSLLFEGFPCVSCTSNCHGMDIRKEIWTQLSVRCATVLSALSLDQFTQHRRKEFVSQRQIGNDSFYSSTSFKKGWELQRSSLLKPKPLMPRKVCASLKTIKHRKWHSGNEYQGLLYP